MAAKRHFQLRRGLTGVFTLLVLTACQQPPAETDAHTVKKTEQVNGRRVNVEETVQQTPEKDRDAVRQGADDIKKTTKSVTFTPSEQQGGK